MNLRLSQFAPEGLDCFVFLLDLCTAVLQLCLQQLGGMFVVGHPVVGFDLGVLQLVILDTQFLIIQTKLSPSANRQAACYAILRQSN